MIETYEGTEDIEYDEPAITTLDIIRADDTILDAHRRPDGRVEAVQAISMVKEKLNVYEPELSEEGNPILVNDEIDSEMYIWNKKLKIYFHSKLTRRLFKKESEANEKPKEQ